MKMAQQKQPKENKQQKPKAIEDLIHDFCQDLQKGDLGLNKLIENGYLLYGQTRSGKTAASHLLSGNALKGVKIGGEDKVENSTSKNRNAKIGNTPVSQTRVPNIFEIKNLNDSNGKAHVIDTPGYGDTYGTLRILGNGYYHYKLYSKVQNMKFILCFDTTQLQNTAQLFIETIVQFTSYFKDYADHKEQIWKSCVFLINKVDENSFSLEDLKIKMMEIQKTIKIQKRQQEIELIREFIRYIVKNDKVFTIKKYKSGESATRADLLKAIDLKSQWWSREINPKNEDEVDMEPIVFNITKPILVELTKNELSKDQFIQLVDHYNDRIKEVFQPLTVANKNQYSLDFVFFELVKDTMGAPDSHNFLEPMKKYVKKYYHLYDQNYKEQREKLQKEMFQIAKGSQSNKKFQSTIKSKIKDKNFIVKKFQVLKNIEDLKQQMQLLDQDQSNQNDKKDLTERNEKLRKAIGEMIKEFNKISYKRQNSPDIIYKYGYIIHRLISEVQVLLLLMNNNKDIRKNKILDAADNKFLSLSSLPNFMGLDYKYGDQLKEFDWKELKSKYIIEVDLNSEQFSNVQINWPLVEFFSSVDISDEFNKENNNYLVNTQNGKNSTPVKNKDENDNNNAPIVIQKIIVLLRKFSEQFLAQKQTKIQNYADTVKLIQKLVAARVNCQQLIALTQDQERIDYFFFITRNVTNNIGKLLENVKKYHLAREVYKSIMSIHSVCELYREEIKSLVSSDKKSNKGLKLRIEYSTFCRQHGRIQEAISILQEAFELCSNKNELQEIKIHLTNAILRAEGGRNGQMQYQKDLYAGKFFSPFSEELVKQIQNQTLAKIQLTSTD